MSADEFIRAHWATVWRAALAVTGDAQLAEDAAQEAFVRALRARHQLGRDRPVEPWLRRIAANCAIDQMRRRHTDWLHVGTEPEPGGVKHVGAAESVVRLSVAAAMVSLPLDQRIVLVLDYWIGLSRREISEALGLAEGTVASRHRLGMARLREAFAEGQRDA